jgi:hypothetical protein
VESEHVSTAHEPSMPAPIGFHAAPEKRPGVALDDVSLPLRDSEYIGAGTPDDVPITEVHAQQVRIGRVLVLVEGFEPTLNRV